MDRVITANFTWLQMEIMEPFVWHQNFECVSNYRMLLDGLRKIFPFGRKGNCEFGSSYVLEFKYSKLIIW